MINNPFVLTASISATAGFVQPLSFRPAPVDIFSPIVNNVNVRSRTNVRVTDIHSSVDDHSTTDSHNTDSHNSSTVDSHDTKTVTKTKTTSTVDDHSSVDSHNNIHNNNHNNIHNTTRDSNNVTINCSDDDVEENATTIINNGVSPEQLTTILKEVIQEEHSVAPAGKKSLRLKKPHSKKSP